MNTMINHDVRVGQTRTPLRVNLSYMRGIPALVWQSALHPRPSRQRRDTA